ncbi:hypothetical protein Tco_1220174 [Tanacetum coccineum]
MNRDNAMLELLSDYDCDNSLSPRESIVVADAYERKEREPRLREAFYRGKLDLVRMDPWPQWRSWLPCLWRFADCDHAPSPQNKVFSIHLGFRGNVSRQPIGLLSYKPSYLNGSGKFTMALSRSFSKSSQGDSSRRRLRGKIIQLSKGWQAARDRQRGYADLKRKPMEFEVGDKVMLKVSPWKGVVRFGKQEKLNPSQGSKNSQRGPEFTWNAEDQFRKEESPHMFLKGNGPSSSAAS